MYEAILRIINIENVQIDGTVMLITACIGLFFNLVNMFVLEYAFNTKKSQENDIKIELGETDEKIDFPILLNRESIDQSSEKSFVAPSQVT